MRVASLFSGAGGMDLGFIRAGHRVVWAIDSYEDAVETYRRNIGDHVILGDIRGVASKEVPDCDIVMGGFPCQGFSVANVSRREEDSRNLLYLELLRIITDKQPIFFVAENVKGILSLAKGRVVAMIMDDFASAGYRVACKVLNAADYGVPQTRERVILVGVRLDIGIHVSFPEPTHADPDSEAQPSLFDTRMKPWVSIGEALAHIPEPEDAPDLPNHTYSKYKLRFNNYLGHRRVDPGRPAPTVTARGDDRGGVVVLHHPGNHRRMSCREMAIAQSFPMGFVFVGSQTSVYRQVANAVPPLMAEAIARAFPREV